MRESDNQWPEGLELRKLELPEMPEITESTQDIPRLVFSYFQNLWQFNGSLAYHTSLMSSMVTKTAHHGDQQFAILRKRYSGLSDAELLERSERLKEYKQRSTKFAGNDRILLAKQQDDALKDLGIKNLGGVKAVEDYALNFTPDQGSAQSLVLGRISVAKTAVFASRTHNLPPEKKLYNLPSIRGGFEVFPFKGQPESTNLFLNGKNVNQKLDSNERQVVINGLNTSLAALIPN